MAVIILVADDDAATRKLYRDVLQSRRYSVHEAGRGDECVAEARRIGPALIILDLQMPVHDGFRAAAELRTHSDTARIPILAVTGVSIPREIERALRAGCNAVLNKPVVPRDLLEAVRTLLETGASDHIRVQAERQREVSSALVRSSYTDLRALLASGEEVGETQIRQWMQGAHVVICSFCDRVRLPGEWRSISSPLKEFLERWTTLSHGICPECMAREYPDSALRG